MDKKTQTGISPVKLKSASELRMAVTDEASAARERIRALFDEGTFSETGAFAHRISSELGGDGCHHRLRRGRRQTRYRFRSGSVENEGRSGCRSR